MIRAHVVTDASWCPKQKVAGYGAYIFCESRHQGYSGPISRSVENSTQAEAIAAAIGASLAFTMHGATQILVLSDNVLVSKDMWKHLPADINAACWIGYRHVSGHTQDPHLASLANRWCDQEAYKQMNALRT